MFVIVLIRLRDMRQGRGIHFLYTLFYPQQFNGFYTLSGRRMQQRARNWKRSGLNAHVGHRDIHRMITVFVNGSHCFTAQAEKKRPEVRGAIMS